MVKIIYKRYDFRHILDIWQDEHPDWKEDIAFIEIKNNFFNQEEVSIRFGILGNSIFNKKKELFFNDTLITFSNSPFCSFYTDILERLYLNKHLF